MTKQHKDINEKPPSTRMSSVFGSDMPRIFDEFSRGMDAWPLYRHALDWEPLHRIEKATGVMSPDIDGTETDTEIRITAELPGMAQADVGVELIGDRLTLRGVKRQVRDEKEQNLHICERRYGAFSRTIRVPETVDMAKVTAEMKDGVLTVVLPKTAGAKAASRKIAIEKG